jgi:multiple sugar transport system substrate-binding protein
MTRRRLLVLLGGALVVALSACRPEIAEPGEMTWAVPVGDAATHQLTADAWNEANPDRPVRLIPTSLDADGQRAQMANILDMESRAFDVLALDVIWTGEFAENGWLVSVEEHRAEVEGVTLDAAFESAVWDEELWALPYSSNAGFLYYRTDLVDRAPETWEELVEVGLEVGEQEGITPLVAQGAQYEGLVVNYLELFWGLGGELYDDAGSALILTEDAASAALAFMRDGFERGLYAEDLPMMMEEDARIAFHRGDAVFMRNWPYAYAVMAGELEEEPSPVAGLYDIAPLPAFADGVGTVTALGGLNNAVSVFSDHRESAVEFALFAATDEDVQRALADEALPPAMAAIYDELADDPVFALLNEVLPTAEPRPPVPEWNDVSVAMHRQVFQAYQGDVDVPAALEQMREEMERALERRLEAAE